ncbi:MAG: hypothetical protein ACXVEE_43910, partial [Polyangiales bacterium]
ADCTTGFCVDGVCCGAAACASGSVCNLAGKAGTCQKTFGATCASDAECGVGTCVDGVCCDTACTGACEACDVPGKEGTCSAVSGAPHGTRVMCAAGDGPCAARTCDGKDRTTCAGWLKGHETTCAEAKCEAGAFIAASRCDGAGACLAPTKTSCSPFACAKDGCLAVCKSDTDCQTGFQCVSARCVDATARCTDDHLSSRASDGRVASCAPYVCGSAGTCQSSCTSSDECAPGFACAAGACVPPVTETSGNDASGGCSYGATRPASGAVVLAFVIALFVLRRRRALWASFALVASCTSQDRGAPLPQTEGPAMREKDWSTVGVMPVSVIHPVVVAQPDGSALFFGVTDGTACCKDVLRFDPTTKNVSKVGSQLTPRVVPLAARVGSGKVLVAGGNGSAGATLSTTELYDPSTNTATAGPTMAVGRWNSVAIPLAGGDVLFVGGAYPGTSIAERYVASTGTFQTSTAPIAPVVATGVQLASGKVLVIPIDTSSPNANALYDPSTNTWSSAGPLLGWPRQDAHLVKLASGKVLVVGASTAWPYSALAELYDPTSNTFTNAAPIPARVYAPIVGLLPSGRVLVAGGQGYSSFRKETLVYDPAADAWRSASPLANEYNTPGGATLSDGRVLIAGDTHVELFTEGAVGATCTQAADCKNLQCVDGVCCGTASCPAGSTCAPGGTCKLAKGIACATDAACGTGHCVDGVCCDTACTEQCGACNVAGKVGTCSAVLGSPRGSRAACTGAGLGTECGASCNGMVTTSCTFAPSGTACGADACTAGIETKKSTCNGSGGCADTSLGCAPYLCGATACKTSCASSTDCAPGAFCRASACVPIEGLGEACTADGECSSGHCVDGVCCATGSCGAGQVCNDPTRKGTCVKSRGTACSVSAECATGHCVDGVCCDAACDGVCEACDVSGKAGTCTPVDGTPHGARPACASSDEICAARTCLGSKDTKTCAGFVAAASTTCAPSKCDASTFVAASTCDGAGACVAPASASCAPYACNAAGCLTACAIDLDCAVGWVCRKSVCMREGT